jgi:excisionase family DNA binding protein
VADIDKIPELISIEQLAQRLSITVRHVRRMIAEKRVPYLKVGRLVRFDPDEIAKWLIASRRPVEGYGPHRVAHPRSTVRGSSSLHRAAISQWGTTGSSRDPRASASREEESPVGINRETGEWPVSGSLP